MRVVLLEQVTRRYYNAPGIWVRVAENAPAFDQASAAREFAHHTDLPNVEPVYRLAPHPKALPKIILSRFVG